MENNESTFSSVRVLLTGFVLTLCSMLFGRGFNPIFAVVALVEPVVSLAALLFYVLVSVLRCVVTWVSSGTTSSLVFFQAVMLLVGYLPLLTLPLFRKFVSSKHFLAGLSLTLASSVYYWWLSNSLCFIQMSGLIPDWIYYSFSLAGYIQCLAAGLSFFLHSLIVSIPAFCLLYSLSHFRILFFNESLSYCR